MSSTYSIFLTGQARKELAKIRKGNPKSAKLISSAITELESQPDLGGLLHGDLKGRRKIRIGDYRIIYRIEKDRLVILVLRIAHRKEVYR